MDYKEETVKTLTVYIIIGHVTNYDQSSRLLV